MTTINNHLTLIDQVGGIEKARAIVEGAPSWATGYAVIQKAYTLYNFYCGDLKLDDLSTAIAQYDTNHCQHGYDLACLICGFGTENGVRVWRKQLESDHVTDIRNHISPNTKVINHG